MAMVETTSEGQRRTMKKNIMKSTTARRSRRSVVEVVKKRGEARGIRTLVRTISCFGFSSHHKLVISI
jgi:hypothetical protein